MLSRVADSLYWMSRYLERAENTARIVDVSTSMLLDAGPMTPEARWNRMVNALGKPGGIPWSGSFELSVRQLVFDSLHPASVTSCLNNARENASQVREEISSEQWQRLNRLFHQIHAPQAQAQFVANPSDTLQSILDGVHLFKGVSDTTMIHGPGWQFIRLGRYLERAYSTATLLDAYRDELFCQHDTSAVHDPELMGLLRSCTSFEAYCQVYTAELSAERILEFLLFNHDFPHAIRYAVDAVHASIEAIESAGSRRAPVELTASIGRMQAMLNFTTVQEILMTDVAGFLHAIRKQCLSIHEMIYRFYVHYSIQSALAS